MLTFSPFASLALLLASRLALVHASVYVIDPVQSSSCTGGQSCTVEWVDNGEAPLLSDIGECQVALYTGEYQLAQSLPSVNVGATSSFTFTVDPNAGPSGQYYLVFSASNSNYQSFSGSFALAGMSGTTPGGSSTSAAPTTTPTGSSTSAGSSTPATSPTNTATASSASTPSGTSNTPTTSPTDSTSATDTTSPTGTTSPTLTTPTATATATTPTASTTSGGLSTTTASRSSTTTSASASASATNAAVRAGSSTSLGGVAALLVLSGFLAF